MTDYIKEMMKTAGVEPIKIIKAFPTYEKASKFGFKLTGTPKLSKGKFEIGSYTNNIDVFQIYWSEYPDFTPEKQLEIIKLIVETQGFCGFINFQDNDKWSISCGRNFPIGPNPIMGINFNPTFRKCETLEQALVQLTIELMKAGELDKEKVKEILEG